MEFSVYDPWDMIRWWFIAVRFDWRCNKIVNVFHVAPRFNPFYPDIDVICIRHCAASSFYNINKQLVTCTQIFLEYLNVQVICLTVYRRCKRFCLHTSNLIIIYVNYIYIMFYYFLLLFYDVIIILISYKGYNIYIYISGTKFW